MKVLVLSRNYPSAALPTLGLWVDHLVRHTAEAGCDVQVVAPVPYCPPLPARLAYYTKFRGVPRRTTRAGVPVWHPRFVVGPGYSTHELEGALYTRGVRVISARLRRAFPFDVVHAHFGYPDGVAGAWLARRYDVPLVITEHSYWTPWMQEYPRAGRQAIRAVQSAAYHVTVSTSLRESVVAYTGARRKTLVVPLGADAETFRPLPDGYAPMRKRLLFVGYLNYTKGVDILLRAMRRLVDLDPEIRLTLVGGGLYRHKDRQGAALRALAVDLGLEGHVTFAGILSPDEVAELMRTCDLLVSASRRETFGAALVEALASGTPVVATRCGGPEDIVTSDVGRLVASEDPEALAAAIADVLAHRDRYSRSVLRSRALALYSWPAIARRMAAIYHDACASKSL